MTILPHSWLTTNVFKAFDVAGGPARSHDEPLCDHMCLQVTHGRHFVPDGTPPAVVANDSQKKVNKDIAILCAETSFISAERGSHQGILS